VSAPRWPPKPLHNLRVLVRVLGLVEAVAAGSEADEQPNVGIARAVCRRMQLFH
jgi:hypothetical protein